MSKVWIWTVTVHFNGLRIGDLVTIPSKHRGGGGAGQGPPKVQNTKICFGYFGLNFIILTRNHYAGSLLWELG
jgi:hypothetical protein